MSIQSFGLLAVLPVTASFKLSGSLVRVLKLIQKDICTGEIYSICHVMVIINIT